MTTLNLFAQHEENEATTKPRQTKRVNFYKLTSGRATIKKVVSVSPSPSKILDTEDYPAGLNPTIVCTEGDIFLVETVNPESEFRHIAIIQVDFTKQHDLNQLTLFTIAKDYTSKRIESKDLLSISDFLIDNGLVFYQEVKDTQLPSLELRHLPTVQQLLEQLMESHPNRAYSAEKLRQSALDYGYATHSFEYTVKETMGELIMMNFKGDMELLKNSAHRAEVTNLECNLDVLLPLLFVGQEEATPQQLLTKLDQQITDYYLSL